MRIAFDYTAARSHWPGVGRYGRELVRALVRRPDCPELVLFDHGRIAGIPPKALGLEAVEPGRISFCRIPGRTKFWRLRARLGLGGIECHLGAVEIVHQAFMAMQPVRGVAHVLPVFELPDLNSKKMRAMAASMAQCQRIVVGSNAGRQELLDGPWAAGLDRSSVCAVTTGADHWLRGAKPLSAEALLAGGPLRFLVLGAIRHARRPLGVLRGFEELVASSAGTGLLRLHFEGRPGDAARELEEALGRSPVAALVTWNREPIEAQMPTLLAGSAVLLHLSRGELSPITPLEAMHFGVSVLTSRLLAFEDVLGEEALVDDEIEIDPRALGAAMACALESGLNQAERTARMEHAAPFTWDACAEDHIAIWRDIIQSSV